MATETNYLKTPQSEKFPTPAKPSGFSQTQPSSISKVRVIVRVRPFLSYEISPQNNSPVPCASVVSPPFESSEEVTVHLKDQETSRNECYKLDSFYGQDDNNVSQIFDKEVSPLIPGLFCGCNATVFAYGATGSGKTYTMQGGDKLPGLMSLAMSNILSMCQSTRSVTKMSYYEVYMDRCYDLLEPKAKEIAVLDDKDGQIHLKGLARVTINSMPEFHEAFSCAIQRRKVAHTGLNDVSSRSHGVLVVAVSTPCDDMSSNVIMGKMNLIDLAGNEDNRRTCNEGIRLQESAKINQSLFTLSNVIYALNNNRSRVPYRESKLTRILQDSLGGTSRALMVACLNPGEYQESVYTVSLAARSRHISNFVPSAQKQETPKVEVDMEAKLRSWLESKGKSKSGQKFGAFGSPFISKTLSSAICMKNPDTSRSSAKPKAVRLINLRHDGGLVDPVMESSDLIAEENSKPELEARSDRIVLESNTCTPGVQPMDKLENTTTKIHAGSIGLSPISGKIEALGNSLRKVLSPICSNIDIGNMSSKDQICLLLFDPKTPKTPYVLNYPNDKFQENDTPLEKFNAQSSNLKSSLVQEYLEVLNTASKEELLGLKGIGKKMADYIHELRETSPIKSLNDLEKIGLSSKQVHNMFGKAAKGLFN